MTAATAHRRHDVLKGIAPLEAVWRERDRLESIRRGLLAKQAEASGRWQAAQAEHRAASTAAILAGKEPPRAPDPEDFQPTGVSTDAFNTLESAIRRLDADERQLVAAHADQIRDRARDAQGALNRKMEPLRRKLQELEAEAGQIESVLRWVDTAVGRPSRGGDGMAAAHRMVGA